MSDNFTLPLRSSIICGALLGATGLLGCSSEGAAGATGTPIPSTTSTTPAPSAGPGHDEFVSKVYPLLKPCASCHETGAASAPIYMGPDAETTYTKIKAYSNIYAPSNDSSLPSKPDHAGPGLDENGKAVARAWLDKEFSAGGGGDVPMTPPPSGGVTGFNAAIQEFVKCMRQDDWEQNMKFFPMVQTQNFGPCAGCHADGNSGTYLNADFNVTFKAMKTVPFVYRLVTADFDNGAVKALDASDRLITKGQASSKCFDPNNVICHDFYIVPKVQAQGLSNFQNSTLSRISGLKCVEP